MSKKLFAMEEMDNEISDVELEVGPEEGEVADVQAEMEAEIADVASDADGIENAEEAGDQLAEVGDLVAGAAEEGEGLDPVAAEALRIAVEAICARVGADPKKMGMYHLYATENFASTSSRKANTQIALEGIKDFLKELWAKIKSAVSNLWKKVTEFWAKHLSSLGRIQKALESMKKKVAASKGEFKGTSILEKAPSGLVSLFPGTGNLSHGRIATVIKSHSDAHTSFATVANSTEKLGNDLVTALNAATPDEADITAKLTALTVKTDAVDFGTEASPLVGGVHYKYEFVKDDENGKVTVTVSTDKAEAGDAEPKMTAGGKDDLKTIIDSTLAVIKTASKVRSELDKSEKTFDKVMSSIQKYISKLDESGQTSVSNALTTIRGVNTNLLTFSTKLIGGDVRLAKGVIGYASASMKLYKE